MQNSEPVNKGDTDNKVEVNPQIDESTNDYKGKKEFKHIVPHGKTKPFEKKVVHEYLDNKKGNPKQFNTNDYVCCEVLDVSADGDRMGLGMKGTLTIDDKAPLVFITAYSCPNITSIN